MGGNSSDNDNADDTLSALIGDHVKAIRATYDGLSEPSDRDRFLMGLRSALQESLPSAMGAPCIEEDIVDCIGKTKLVKLRKIPSVVLGDDNDNDDDGGEPGGEVVAKLEFTNPGLSVKDRIARRMLEEAELNGTIKPYVISIDRWMDGWMNTGHSDVVVGRSCWCE